MEIKPITFKQASDFINRNYRHHKATIGHKFSVGLYEGEQLISCAVCGRPVSRYLDDCLTCEIRFNRHLVGKKGKDGKQYNI